MSRCTSTAGWTSTRTSAASSGSWTTTADARTGASATSRRPRRSRRDTRTGMPSPLCGIGSMPMACSRTNTWRAYLASNRGRQLVLILVVALGLRVGLVVATGEHVPWGDPVDYHRHAARLTESGTYPPSTQAAPGSPAAFRPPAWPYLLAGVYEVTGTSLTAGRLAAAALGTLAVLLVYLI